MLEKELKDPKIVAALITAIVHAIEKEGLDANLQATVAEKISPRDINELLGKEVLAKLKDHTVTLGSFKGGAQVKIIDRENDD